MHVNFDMVSGGAYMMNRYGNRVTAPAFMLSQMFLAAPLQAHKAYAALKMRIPTDPMLEGRLVELLTEMQRKAKWEDVRVYEAQALELGYLIRMEKVDYSPKKGRVRASKEP